MMTEVMPEVMPELIKWYALDQNGDMVYVGEFETFEAADESLNTNVVWLVDEETARTWLTQLKEMMK
jgi:glycerol-3-phosphate responsive antiterminator